MAGLAAEAARWPVPCGPVRCIVVGSISRGLKLILLTLLSLSLSTSSKSAPSADDPATSTSTKLCLLYCAGSLPPPAAAADPPPPLLAEAVPTLRACTRVEWEAVVRMQNKIGTCKNRILSENILSDFSRFPSFPELPLVLPACLLGCSAAPISLFGSLSSAIP